MIARALPRVLPVPTAPVEKLRWSITALGTAMAALALSLLQHGGRGAWTMVAGAALLVAVGHWIAALPRGRLLPTVDAAVVAGLWAAGPGAGLALEDGGIAFAFGAVSVRALYPRRVPLEVGLYPLAVAGAWVQVRGPGILLHPPVIIVLSSLALCALLFRVVARALEGHEATRDELARAKAEMQRRVEERTRELAEANDTLQEKVREVEMTESLLRRSEEYFRALIENGSDLLVLLRPDGRIRYYSPSVRRVLGYEADEVWDRVFSEFVHGEDLARALEVFNHVLEEPGRSERLMLRVRAADGSHRHLEAVAQNLLADSAVGGVVFTSRDVTDRMAMERVVQGQESQLRHAQKMEAVGRLAGGVAHDFNNILTVIGGHAEYMADRIAPPDPLHSEAVEIRDAVDRAARLTRQLLVFSRSEVAQPRILNLDERVASVHKLARRLVPETVRFETRLAARRWRVLADVGLLEQVVMNLVVNARDAVAEDGTITVETADEEVDALIRTPMGDIAPGRYVVLTVRDDGCGIAPEIQDRIFDPFFTTKGASGTGLGLSTVFGIVRDAAGVIAVESRPGAGSAFRVYFPARDEPAEPSGAPAPEELGPALVGETVLYVEDEDRLRVLTARTLRERGYLVLSAANGPDALRLAELYREPLDLLLTDVVMPGMTGPELHVALEEARGRVPVLFLSGYPGEELARRGFRGPLLPKPYRGRELLGEVRRVLDEG